MSNNNEKKSCQSSSAPNQCGLLFLLLLVGFLFGLITGFAIKDTVVRNLSRTIYAAVQNNDAEVPEKNFGSTPGITETNVVEDVVSVEITPTLNSETKTTEIVAENKDKSDEKSEVKAEDKDKNKEPAENPSPELKTTETKPAE
jgi:hypothetical protein